MRMLVKWDDYEIADHDKEDLTCCWTSLPSTDPLLRTIVYFKQVTCVRQSNRETTQPEKAALAVRLSTYTRFHVVLGLGISPNSRSGRFQIPGQVRALGVLRCRQRDPVPGLELREQESENKACRSTLCCKNQTSNCCRNPNIQNCL